MDFGNISDDILDFPYLQTMDGPTTLRREIFNLYVDEDIIYGNYEINGEGELTGQINKFVAWTDSYVVTLIRNSIGEDQLIMLSRDPEINN